MTPTLEQVQQIVTEYCHLQEDEETALFLSKEIVDNLPSSLLSKQNMYSLLQDHLLNFNLATSTKEALRLCETLVEECNDSSNFEQEETEEEEEEYNSDKEYEDGTCLLCGRDMPLTFHHLIPRTTHKKLLKRNLYTPKELNHGIMVCRPCHSAIHKLIDEETMAQEFNTLEKLESYEPVQKWVAYAAKQKAVGKDQANQYHHGQMRYPK